MAKSCPKCGTFNDDAASVCSFCKRPLSTKSGNSYKEERSRRGGSSKKLIGWLVTLIIVAAIVVVVPQIPWVQETWDKITMKVDYNLGDAHENPIDVFFGGIDKFDDEKVQNTYPEFVKTKLKSSGKLEDKYSEMLDSLPYDFSKIRVDKVGVKEETHFSESQLDLFKNDLESAYFGSVNLEDGYKLVCYVKVTGGKEPFEADFYVYKVNGNWNIYRINDAKFYD